MGNTTRKKQILVSGAAVIIAIAIVAALKIVGAVISATLIAEAASVAIVAIVGYIIIKKKQIKFKWWFPLAIIVTLWAIMFIVSIVVHYMGWFE